MKEPAISVAMATYNGERFLQEQLDSLARQTLLPCELVACDDGSTDGTLDILHIFAAKAPFRVRIYQNPQRLGCADNFLRAVGLCEGSLVAFSDQDDVWLPRKLEVCSQRFASRGVAMVIHLAMLTDTDLRPLGRTWPHLGRTRTTTQGAITLQFMDVAGMTMIFRREVAAPLLSDSALRLTLIKGCAGHDTAMRFVAEAYGSVAHAREVLALHRCHGANTSGSHRASASTASAYILGVKGLRNRIGAPVKWLKTHTGLARGTGWHDYAREVDFLRSRAEGLGLAATRADGRLRAMLERSSAVLARRTDAVAERSLLYRDTPGWARSRFLRMVIRGCYGRRNRGGLGLWSLAKDCRFLFCSTSSSDAPLGGSRESRDARGRSGGQRPRLQ